MCMKNMNATMLMCLSVKNQNGGIDSFEHIFDSIIPGREENQYFIDGMNVVIDASIIFGDSDGEDCIKLNQEYEYMVRLTHVESGLGIPLYTFKLAIPKDELRTWCKNFYELKRVIKLPRIYLPKGLGNYALKLLVRPVELGSDAGWTTQTIHSLVIGDAN